MYYFFFIFSCFPNKIKIPKCRVFTSENNYSKLEKALESIITKEDDAEYDLIVLPPEPSAVSDDKEGNEDDLFSSNLPKDVPGTLEVFRRHADHDISDWDESDD